MKIIILKGAKGSGKTTLAEYLHKLYENSKICKHIQDIDETLDYNIFDGIQDDEIEPIFNMENVKVYYFNLKVNDVNAFDEREVEKDKSIIQQKAYEEDFYRYVENYKDKVVFYMLTSDQNIEDTKIDLLTILKN